jgi:hypothetical protein
MKSSILSLFHLLRQGNPGPCVTAFRGQRRGSLDTSELHSICTSLTLGRCHFTTSSPSHPNGLQISPTILRSSLSTREREEKLLASPPSTLRSPLFKAATLIARTSSAGTGARSLSLFLSAGPRWMTIYRVPSKKKMSRTPEGPDPLTPVRIINHTTVVNTHTSWHASPLVYRNLPSIHWSA